MDPILYHFYRDIFLQTLARNLPWILGALGMTGLVAYSPLGRAIETLAGQLRRGRDLDESVSARLADLQHTLSEVAERLDATERALAQERRPQLLPKPPAVPLEPAVQTPRVATPV